MEELRLEKVTKKYGALVAVSDVSLAVRPSEYIFILGPNACGKSVLLRMIAGLEEPTSGEIFIKVYTDEKWLFIEIIDTGKGIHAEIQKNIFNVYFSTKRSGTGLGLATAKRIIENHKGVLELVMSEVDTGTNFRIKLPLYKSE